MHKHSFSALGTTFTLTVWDEMTDVAFVDVCARVIQKTKTFDALYSRFKSDSLVTRLSREVGRNEVPADLVTMLRLYERLYTATGGAINPAIGFALSDSGYDASYTLSEQDSIRDVPPLHEALSIISDTEIDLHQNVLLDLGALGKGYLVDLIYTDLRSFGIDRFLIDGSGDIRYFAADNTPIVCALEHPVEPASAIGTLTISSGALCASAINRRAWGERHHYIDPKTKASPTDIIATWVYAEGTALADGLSSALFFSPPEALRDFRFEYCVVNKGLERKNSPGFADEFFF